MLNSYKELIVWQKSLDLVEKVYFLTSRLPKEETYGLSSQMRRAAVSIPSNIAEGQRRKDLPEYIQFLRIADSSSAELETQLIISKRLYQNENYKDIEMLLSEVQKMLNVMIGKLYEKNLKPKNFNLKAKGGFTMAELMISIGLFVILTGIASGGFIQALRNQRMVTALMSVNDNMGITMEQMAREIRTGFKFCTKKFPISLLPECGSLGDNELQFVNSRNEVVRYRLVNGAIERGSNAVVCQSPSGDICYNPITAGDIDVKSLKFNLIGNNPGSTIPPRITIAISFSSTSPDIQRLKGFSVNIQTTVSARNF